MLQVLCHKPVISHAKNRLWSLLPKLDFHWILAECSPHQTDRKNQRKKENRQNDFGDDCAQGGTQGKPEYGERLKNGWIDHDYEQKDDGHQNENGRFPNLVANKAYKN